MYYYSTNNKYLQYSFKDAVLKGLAPDKGLFFPTSIPKLEKKWISNLQGKSIAEIGYDVAKLFVGDDLHQSELKKITEEVFNFPIPLVQVENSVFSLELFHGPTCAFKDVGARFMSRCMGVFARKDHKEVTILVATSGDTGSAVANGFLGIDGVNVIILYPKSKVSKIQEQQLTTMGQNITALEIDGSFDDCQDLVKSAFADTDLHTKMNLTSANSINIARLIPQSFYYFYSIAQLPKTNKEIIVSVPSGNYGNLTGGLLAKQMGLPIKNFIAASNRNNIVPKYLESGIFHPKSSVQTISNAMDVGNPSNFTRIMELYQNNHAKVISDIKGAWFNDEDTKMAMKKVFDDKNYILDPHGAVAYLGLKKYLDEKKQLGIFLETAHPAKFLETVEEVICKKVQVPDYLTECLNKKKKCIAIGKDFENFKNYLLNR